jgi:hypothetical protein
VLFGLSFSQKSLLRFFRLRTPCYGYGLISRPYKLSSLSVGLLYLAPFIGGILGSSISGKISDIVCRYMTRRNGGVFEPEFRLVMVILVAISTVMGSDFSDSLMLGLWGFGWSAQVQDPWIAPTVFFGVIGTHLSLHCETV